MTPTKPPARLVRQELALQFDTQANCVRYSKRARRWQWTEGDGWNDAEPEEVAKAEAAAGKLHGAGGQSKMAVPSPRSRRVSPRIEKEPDTTTYSGRVAARIRMLRKRSGMTREQFHAALAKHGLTVALSNVYAWENGNKGVNPDHYPAIAKALGCKSVRSLLPEN